MEKDGRPLRPACTSTRTWRESIPTSAVDATEAFMPAPYGQPATHTPREVHSHFEYNLRVARPETITCERCGDTVLVKAKGPVPSYCASCRRARPNTAKPRPTTVPCRDCGQAVPVAARGPLPRTCRGRCRPQESPRPQTAPAGTSPERRTPLRPWDSTPVETPGAPPPADVPQAAPPPPADATRIDAVGGVLIGTRTIERRVWLHRVRRVAATAAWILFILIVALIVVYGGRPTPL